MASALPELTYFNVPGRVAGLRMAMFAAFQKDGWVDKRIEFTQWPELKKTLPPQYVPVLSLPCGTQVHQADAVLRWVGKRCGLYPTQDDEASLREALLIDEMVSTIYESLSKAPRSSSVVTKDMLPKLWEEFLAGPQRMY